MSEIVFKSSFGKVDGIYSHSRNSNSPAVLIASNNNDKFIKKNSSFMDITEIVFDIFVKNNFSVLKFNLVERDVDKTEVDNANLLDMTAALDWLHNKNIECRSFWICGIDYAALTALQLIMRRPELENYVIISPNIKKNDLSFIIPCSACGFIIRGSEDIKFTEDECIGLQEKLVTKAESKVRYTTIYKTERDFVNELEQFKSELSNYIKEKIIEDRKNLKRVTAGKRRRRKKKILDSEEEKIIYINPIKNLDIEYI